MWLKKHIEKHYIHFLQEFYSRADKRFSLRKEIKTVPSYLNKTQFHILGYVQKAYTINGSTYLELKSANCEVLVITAPPFTQAEELEFQAVLCTSVVEHHNDILDNTVCSRTCSSVMVL